MHEHIQTYTHARWQPYTVPDYYPDPQESNHKKTAIKRVE